MSKEELIELPFDQYSRQLIVSQIVEAALRPQLKNKQIKFIDLGGYKGQTKAFFPKDKVTILDVFDVDEEDYIKGDATDIACADDFYDIACSFDVLEHIPRSGREDFIIEASRVSSIGFFIAAPVDDKHKKVSRAEVIANDIFKTVNNEDHRWLKEHLEYQIPTKNDIENIFKGHGLYYASGKSNEINKWLAMQSVFFTKSVLDNPHNFLKSKYHPEFLEFHKILDKMYNQNFNTLEVHDGDTSYRTIYFASKNKKYVDSVKAFLDEESKKVKANKNDIENVTIELYGTVFQTIASTINLMQQRGNELVVSVSELEESVSKLELEYNEINIRLRKSNREIIKRDKYMNDLLNSTSWKLTKPLRKMSQFVNRTVK